MTGEGVTSQVSVVHLVVTEGFAGVERYVCQVANQLAARGHRVTTLGGDSHRMRAELADGITNRPAATLVGAARALAGLDGVDIVHVHMTSAEGAAWLARRITRSEQSRSAPIVATRHFASDRGSNIIAGALARVTSRSISLDIAISRFVAAGISGPSVVIPNGVEDRPQAPLVAKTVTMLQRLDTEKAPAVGIRAWALSRLADEDWRLTVAGSGRLRSSLVELASEMGVTDSVDFVGRIDDTDRLLSESSVLLAPAPAEPFGLSVVEAMAHGLPVVAARGGAHVETVGDHGMLFAVDQSDAAGGALRRLAHDPALRRQVGARLRQRQHRLFSLAGHVDRLEEIYRQLVIERQTLSR